MASCFIFFQIYLNMVNLVDGSSLAALILAFNICRLIQFLFSGILGIQMLQSNMVCLALASVALVQLNQQSVFGILASLILTLDAIMGAAVFVALNEKEIKDSLSFVRKMRSFKTSSKSSQKINIAYMDDSFGSII